MSNLKKAIKILLYSLYTSTFSFGGGFVAISIMKKFYVDKHKWLTDMDMSNIATIAQSSPGAISINACLLVGYNIAGFLGAIMAVIGTTIPPLVILCVVSIVYDKIITNAIVGAVLVGMQAGICAILLDICLSLSRNIVKEKNYFAIITLPIAFALTFWLKTNVIYIILPCAGLGIIISAIQYIAKKKKALPQSIIPTADIDITTERNTSNEQTNIDIANTTINNNEYIDNINPSIDIITQTTQQDDISLPSRLDKEDK